VIDPTVRVAKELAAGEFSINFDPAAAGILEQVGRCICACHQCLMFHSGSCVVQGLQGLQSSHTLKAWSSTGVYVHDLSLISSVSLWRTVWLRSSLHSSNNSYLFASKLI
jgi:hypothetical protein